MHVTSYCKGMQTLPKKIPLPNTQHNPTQHGCLQHICYRIKIWHIIDVIIKCTEHEPDNMAANCSGNATVLCKRLQTCLGMVQLPSVSVSLENFLDVQTLMLNRIMQKKALHVCTSFGMESYESVWMLIVLMFVFNPRILFSWAMIQIIYYSTYTASPNLQK